ncbi:hypothetical protein HGRIS_010633 [Hohenbuehelia grisea]|uniref:Uncharacterized protein n=1 Tax=Hohenbuehelia grisea TaxID=104357 RepID=A0ABR3IXT6_9AGAR
MLKMLRVRMRNPTTTRRQPQHNGNFDSGSSHASTSCLVVTHESNFGVQSTQFIEYRYKQIAATGLQRVFRPGVLMSTENQISKTRCSCGDPHCFFSSFDTIPGFSIGIGFGVALVWCIIYAVWDFTLLVLFFGGTDGSERGSFIVGGIMTYDYVQKYCAFSSTYESSLRNAWYRY